MLRQLRLQQFTVFKDATFDFGQGLNVLVGDNGTGKTQVLKVGYLFCRAWPDLTAKRNQLSVQRAEAYLDDRLAGLFRVKDLGDLIRLGHKNGARLGAQVEGHIPTVRVRVPSDPPPTSPGLAEPMPWDIQIKRGRAGAPSGVEAETLPVVRSGAVAETLPVGAAQNAFMPRPVFVPSKEIVSLFKGLVGLFEHYSGFPLDDTYRDLAVALSTLETQQENPLLPEVAQRIRSVLAGDLKLEDGDLIFVRNDGCKLQAQLMAEGHRKLALLIYMLRTGLVEIGSTVFWDEPEANLNPAAIRLLAQALHVIAGMGAQVILATHSLFLLREFEILQLANKSAGAVAIRYFGLGATKAGVKVTQGDDVAAIDPLVLLDESLGQSGRYNEVAP